MDGKTMNEPPIPETSIVHEVIRLADAYAAVRDSGHAAGLVAYDLSKVNAFERVPARDHLLNYLRPLSAECLAGLYALYRLGDGPSGTATGNAKRYSSSYANAMVPHHHEHAAADLVAKGPSPTDSAGGWVGSGSTPIRADRAGMATSSCPSLRGPADEVIRIEDRVPETGRG